MTFDTSEFWDLGPVVVWLFPVCQCYRWEKHPRLLIRSTGGGAQPLGTFFLSTEKLIFTAVCVTGKPLPNIKMYQAVIPSLSWQSSPNIQWRNYIEQKYDADSPLRAKMVTR